MTAKIKRVGQRVTVIHRDARAHKLAGGLAVNGTIVEIDEAHKVGKVSRPIGVVFDDMGIEYVSWWKRKELRVI